MINIKERYQQFAASHPQFAFFLRYTLLFTMLWLSLASMALYNIIATEANPFFYANF